MPKSTPPDVVPDRVSEEAKIDRILVLPEELLFRIMSFLPTYWAARCSVISRLFRRVWEATHLKEDCSRHFPDMDDCALLRRSSSYPLHHLTLYPHFNMTTNQLGSLLLKAQLLGVRHLRIDLPGLDGSYSSILPVIFSFNDLLSLSFSNLSTMNFHFPFDMSLTRLKRLSLSLYDRDHVKLNEFLSNLCSLEELFLETYEAQVLKLASRSVKKLELSALNRCLWILEISMPNLESLDLTISLGLLHFSGEMPQLTKAYICIGEVSPVRVPAICNLLKNMKNVESLQLDLTQPLAEFLAFHMLLEPGKEPPIFSDLKFLDLRFSFHDKNMEDLKTLLQNTPVLESLMLIHKRPKRETYYTRRAFRTRIPRDVDDNFQNVYFQDLRIEENKKQLMELLATKRTLKRIKR